MKKQKSKIIEVHQSAELHKAPVNLHPLMEKTQECLTSGSQMTMMTRRSPSGFSGREQNSWWVDSSQPRVWFEGKMSSNTWAQSTEALVSHQHMDIVKACLSQQVKQGQFNSICTCFCIQTYFVPLFSFCLMLQLSPSSSPLTFPGWNNVYICICCCVLSQWHELFYDIFGQNT